MWQRTHESQFGTYNSCVQLESLRRGSTERGYGGLYVNMLWKRCEYVHVLVERN